MKTRNITEEIKRQIAFNLQNGNQPSMDCYYDFITKDCAYIRWGFMPHFGYDKVVVFCGNTHLGNIPSEELYNYPNIPKI